MSYTNINNVKMVDKTLVDKILEQGQKLRNAMVGSILRNDPFNTEIIYNKQFNSPQTSRTELEKFKLVDNVTSLDEQRLEAFIRGEYMTREEEKLALDTLRSLSAPALCKTTEKSLSSARLSTCRCYTCQIYNSNNSYCDLGRKNVKGTVDKSHPYPLNEVTKDIQEKYRTENGNILKYVDSIKVAVGSLNLNEMGNQKVLSSEDKKVPYNLSQAYFLEYSVPDRLVNKSIVSKSKVNSGLETNHVRLCSRRNNGTINFKQVTIHDVKNLDKLNLNEYELKFKLSYRTAKQKSASLLGVAKFNLGSFLHSKNLTCHRGLSVFLNENSPIVMGTLKVSLQLGCGRLYFGQEFIDAINTTKRNSVVLDSDDSASQLNNLKLNRDKVFDDNFKEVYPKGNVSDRKVDDLLKGSIDTTTNDFKKSGRDERLDLRCRKNEIRGVTKHSSYFDRVSENNSVENKNLQVSDSVFEVTKSEGREKVFTQQISENEKQILFGFLYVAEAQYLSDPINTYLTCRPFCQNETSCSKLVTNSSHPVFNFCQLVPLIFEDDLLHLLRENYMVVEFWQKTESTDVVIGLTKIFLHQFYLAYRNPVILKYLRRNQLPIIGTDWWEPIYAINTEEVLGQVQVLIALGTEQQINNLKTERGFTNNIVRAKFPHPKPLSAGLVGKKIEPQKTDIKISTQRQNSQKVTESHGGNQNDSTRNLESERKKVDRAVSASVPPITKSDVGVQSNLGKMDKNEERQQYEKTTATQEMLGSFLNQMMAQRQRNVFVENSTNTEPVQPNTGSGNPTLRQAQSNTNVELRKTTDLLDSLQKALSLDVVNNVPSVRKRSDMFRANVTVNGANHLPSRKKCKSRRSKNRSAKNEENVLPSCYVTFETVAENDLKITPVVSKSTSPVWNYKCDVELPIDLLTNNQKRLIFKVWRKSTNAVLQPNMQTDTVLGFAAVDLTVLLAGFPNVQGWFNIVDFSGKCNGQINIHITPLENLSRFATQKECSCAVPAAAKEGEVSNAEAEVEPGETLSRALKRKFTELDEITQRLRLRLSKVTSEDSDGSSDGVADEFEKDINTLCVEEDFNLINFEDDSRRLNFNNDKDDGGGNTKGDERMGLITLEENDGAASSSDLMQFVGEKRGDNSNTGDLNAEAALGVAAEGVKESTQRELAALDKQLLQGKQRIDTLLEKLSLLSTDTGNPFTSRYVSGCSINADNPSNIDTEAILNELDHFSRPNIQSSSGFDPIAFQQLYGGSVYSNSVKTSNVTTPLTSNSTSNSDTSLITNFSDCRPAPDGQGNASDEKAGKKE